MNNLSRSVILLGMMASLTACGPAKPDKPSAAAGAAAPVVGGSPSAVVGAASAMPRDNLPDFVETFPNGVYGYSNKSVLNGQARGLLGYGATGSAAEVVAFHKASMERQGLTVSPEVRSEEEGRVRIRIEGSDGTRTLSAEVVDRGEPDVVVTLNFSGPA